MRFTLELSLIYEISHRETKSTILGLLVSGFQKPKVIVPIIGINDVTF